MFISITIRLLTLNKGSPDLARLPHGPRTLPGVILWYYFDSELCWHNYCAMLNKIIMTLERLVSNPLRKQMFHQDIMYSIGYRNIVHEYNNLCINIK